MTTTELRHADLAALTNLLSHTAVRRHDVVLPPKALYFGPDGRVHLDYHSDVELTDSGVTPAEHVDDWFHPTVVAEEQLADKLGIPRPYWQRCSKEATELLAQNANHWLERQGGALMCRTLKANGEPGVLRAVLSDRFRPMDNLDVLISALDGVVAAGVDPGSLQVNCDLSMRRMYVRISAPTVAIEAADIAARYTDPRTGRSGRDYPIVEAGLLLSNSDVGQGAFTIKPRVTFLVCTNGMTRTKDSMRQVHLGGRQDEGVIDWSDETMRRRLAVIASETTDAVRTFLSRDYLTTVVRELRAFAHDKVDDPVATIGTVTTRLRYSADERQLVLNAFLHGGDLTALGVAQAITNVAQELDADRAAQFEDDAFSAMEYASAATR